MGKKKASGGNRIEPVEELRVERTVELAQARFDQAFEDRSEVRKVGPFRMVKNSHPGDTLTGHAKVTSKELEKDQGIVHLEIGVDNPRGEAARGEVTVALPV